MYNLSITCCGFQNIPVTTKGERPSTAYNLLTRITHLTNTLPTVSQIKSLPFVLTCQNV
jgi:hypothetical protein